MNPTNDTAGQPAENTERGDAACAAFAGFLGTVDFEIIAELTGGCRPATRFVCSAPLEEPAQPHDISGRRLHRWCESAAPTRVIGGSRPLRARGARSRSTPSLTIQPVAIDPTSNDLVIPECSTARETAIVTAPKSGAAANAGAYASRHHRQHWANRCGFRDHRVVNDPLFCDFRRGPGRGNIRTSRSRTV
jgi:hypothetical protein